MSYTLLVFDPAVVPVDPERFVSWLEGGPKPNAREAVDPGTASPILQAWYRDMIHDFSALNGQDAVRDRVIAPSKMADYTFCRDRIFASFSWSAAADAWNCVLALAQKHSVGLWDSSCSVDVLGPLPNGEYDVLFTVSAPND